MADLGLKKSLIVITGARGIGKTTAAATYLPPSQVGRIFYHDGEHSTNRIVEQLAHHGLKFGYLNHLDERWTKGLPDNTDLLDRIAKGRLPWANTKEKNSLIDFYKYIIDDINKHMTLGAFSVYVHDPVERLEAAMAAWVDNNPSDAGWSSRAHGRTWTEGFYPLYRGLMEAIYARGVDVIIFTAHQGNVWEGKGNDTHIVPGKVKVRAKPELVKLTQLYVWLIEEPRNADGAPAGLILKERLGELNVESDTWKLRSGLPHRIPHFTWDDVQRYIQEGFDQTNPAQGEILSEQEAQIIDDTFYSDEQMKLMLLWAKTDLAQIAASNPSLLTMAGEINVSPEGLARELSQAGITSEQIAEQLGKPVMLINKWLGGS